MELNEVNEKKVKGHSITWKLVFDDRIWFLELELENQKRAKNVLHF